MKFIIETTDATLVAALLAVANGASFTAPNGTNEAASAPTPSIVAASPTPPTAAPAAIPAAAAASVVPSTPAAPASMPTPASAPVDPIAAAEADGWAKHPENPAYHWKGSEVIETAKLAEKYASQAASVTFDHLKAAVATYVAKLGNDGAAGLKGLLTQFGAASAKDLKPEQYAAFHAALSA